MLHENDTFLSIEEINEILALPTVVAHCPPAQDINSQTTFYLLKTELPPSVVDKMTQVGILVRDQVPLRWITGNTAAHVDTSQTSFTTTHIIYLVGVAGWLYVGTEPHALRAGTWYEFAENTLHYTDIPDGQHPRLCLGPMNEYGIVVGCPQILYYTDATAETYIDSTTYCGEDPEYFATESIAAQYKPANSVFVGWYVFEIPYGDDPQYSVGQIVPAGSIYNTLVGYNVYPVWQTTTPRIPLHFTDNSRVYYKAGSLAPGGVNTVVNSRYKSRRV
jgi:hypothetical protein